MLGVRWLEIREPMLNRLSSRSIAWSRSKKFGCFGDWLRAEGFELKEALWNICLGLTINVLESMVHVHGLGFRMSRFGLCTHDKRLAI